MRPKQTRNATADFCGKFVRGAREGAEGRVGALGNGALAAIAAAHTHANPPDIPLPHTHTHIQVMHPPSPTCVAAKGRLLMESLSTMRSSCFTYTWLPLARLGMS